jgi:dTDP-4-dehydrorhamnose 3,5-epimerase
MEVHALSIPEVKVLRPARFEDHRGFLSETFSRRTLARHGIAFEVAQENHSCSRAVGTVRGLHFQTPPAVQAKIVRIVRGRAYDVAVDLRRGSPTYGHWAAAELTAEFGEQMYVPAGFAHGFCTLEPDTEMVYLVSDFHVREAERAIRWDDPDLAIPWPVSVEAAVLSDKDRAAELFSTFETPF